MNKPNSVRTELVPAYAVIHLTGAFNIFIEEDIEREFSELLELKCPLILLDFIQAEHINSAGITILVGIAARAREAGVCLTAYGLSDHYRKIFQMVGLQDYITLGENRESLLKEYRSDRS